MAGSPVRELITRVKFQVDNSSFGKVEKQVDKIKKSLDKLSKKYKINVDTKINNVQKLAQVTAMLHALPHHHNISIGINASHVNNVLSQVHSSLNSIQAHASSAMAANAAAGAHATSQPTSRMERLRNFADNAASTAAAGGAMTASVALPVNTAIDFDAAMAKVKAITNATDEDFQRLTASAKELGATTPHSAKQVAAAMSYLGMAGWKTEQILAGLPTVLNLATASGEDLARVADIVSDDLTAFQMPASDAAHMADVMAATATNANTNISMMGETFKYAGAVAGSLGYSVEDVAAATGLMANSGIKAEQAGTSLRQIMSRLIAPPKEAAEALDMLGFSATNADGTIKPFRQQLIELRNAMAGLSDEEKTTAADSIAGMYALSGFLAVVNASDEDFNKMTAAVDNSNGAAEKMAATMHATTQGAINDFKSAIEGLEIEASAGLLPALTELVNGLTGVIRSLNEFASAHPQVAAGIMAFVGVIGTLLTVLGTVGIFLGGILNVIEVLGPVATAVGSAFAEAWALIASVVEVVGAAIAGLSATAIAAILAIIAVIVLCIAYWDELKAFVISVGEAIGNAAKAAAAILQSAFDSAIEAVKGFFAGLRDFALGVISDIANAISSWLGEKIAWAKSAIGDLQSFASNVIDGIGFGGGGSDNRSYNQTNNVNVASVGEATSFVNGSTFFAYD